MITRREAFAEWPFGAAENGDLPTAALIDSIHALSDGG
jgi:hypothetical protein